MIFSINYTEFEIFYCISLGVEKQQMQVQKGFDTNAGASAGTKNVVFGF